MKAPQTIKEKYAASRIIIAGTGGDSGKTLVSMGLAASWRRRGLRVAVFKKGPDYIDAAWLRQAAGEKPRNLDTYMMGREGVVTSFYNNSRNADISLIEGNRGLYDGFDKEGTHSTGELAKLLKSPVILVKDVTKVTRTAAAEILGCIHLDPDVEIVGVVLNRVAGQRHEQVIRDAVESICQIPVLGAIPKLSSENLLPDRHLGLVTPEEHPELEAIAARTAEIIDKYLDVEKIRDLAKVTRDLHLEMVPPRSLVPTRRTKIAFFSDSAFTFYYQDNLDALENAGAELIAVSSLRDPVLPVCDGLYIGGGFPETHASLLSDNRSLLDSVRTEAEKGLPVFAECGGLIYLCRSISYRDESFPLAGIFPIDLKMMPKPQGHGYMEVQVDRENPFFSRNTIIRGHEFHYSVMDISGQEIESIYKVIKGVGSFNKRDGLIYKNILASYLHIHAAGVPQWAENFVKIANGTKK